MSRNCALIVDDDADLRFLLGTELRLQGAFAEVLEAPDGADAVAIAEREQPRVIVLDHDMPGASGLDVLPVLRHRCPDARIVVFSGNDSLRVRALDSGADEFQSKSRPLRELLARVAG